VRLPPVSSRNRSSSRSGDLLRRERSQARRGQLDRQWQPVEPSADLDDGPHVGVGHGEARPHGGRAVREQLDRREGQGVGRP
jgi:hypothetical protein